MFVAAVVVAFLWLEWLMSRETFAEAGGGSVAEVQSSWVQRTPRMPRLPLKMPSLQQQFAEAKQRIRQITTGTVGRKGWRLQEAVLACRAVNNYWPGRGLMQAEAAYREGELWLRLEQPGDAVAAFQVCIDAARSEEQGATADDANGAEFAPRARLQLAHIHRRAGRFGKAIHSYGLVQSESAATLRHCNDALEWQGRCWMELGQWTLAAQGFAHWREQSEGPLEEVRATDYQAQALLRGGHTTAAEVLLSDLQSRLRQQSLEPTPEGRALFEALGRIRAEVQLRAVRQFGENYGDGEVVGMAHRQAEARNPVLVG